VSLILGADAGQRPFFYKKPNKMKACFASLLERLAREKKKARESEPF
jgi:hypothetical protein